MKSILFIAILTVLQILIGCSSIQRNESSTIESAFINENFFQIVDSSILFNYNDFFVDTNINKVKNRDSLIVSVWHQLLSFNEYSNILPNLIQKEYFNEFVSVLDDTISKKYNNEFDLKQQQLGLIKLVPRKDKLSKIKDSSTIGDLQFYRVLFNPNNDHAITLVYFWSGPKSAVLKLFLFKKQKAKWVKIKTEILEQS